MATLEAERVTACYNLALGAKAGTLRLRAQDTMTRVLAADGVEAETNFDIPARSLDELATEFASPHVSLLKIDVEGFEAEVLAGAAGLLAAQAVDMIYIEAGLDPETRQQTYYRAIEDYLRAHGYRMFRIYEQHNEWATDLPVLRRVNLAFISDKFADGNPLRLSTELFALRKDHDELQRTLAESRRALESLRAEAAAAAERVAGRDRALAEREAARLEAARREAELEAELADQAEALKAAERKRAEAARQLAQLTEELDRLKSYGRTLETRHLDMLESETWRIMEPARRTIRLLTGRRPPVPFTPRLVDRRGAPARPGAAGGAEAAPKLSRGEAQKTANQLIALAGKWDYPALVAKEAQFARHERLDQFFFLRRFSRLLATKRLSAFAEASALHDQIEARLGQKHSWLIDFFGPQVYLRYTIDASTALTRVGRLDEAQLLRGRGAGATRRERRAPAAPGGNALALRARGGARRSRRGDDHGRACEAPTPCSGPISTCGRAQRPRRRSRPGWPSIRGWRWPPSPPPRGSGDFPAYRTWLNRYFEAQGLIRSPARGRRALRLRRAGGERRADEPGRAARQRGDDDLRQRRDARLRGAVAHRPDPRQPGDPHRRRLQRRWHARPAGRARRR